MTAITLAQNADGSWSLLELTLDDQSQILVDVVEHGSTNSLGAMFQAVPALIYEIWHPGGKRSFEKRKKEKETS